MKLPKLLLQGIDDFLSVLPPKVLKRGRDDFARGDVTQLECVEPNHLYLALVSEGADYEVGLEWQRFGWATECSCALAGDCRHAVAALLELRQQAGGAPRMGAPKAVPQPPRSPVADKLRAHLGRELRLEESHFVRSLQTSYATVRLRPLVESDLEAMARGTSATFVGYGSWKPVELWPEFPRDDFHFWLHVAWELRRRGLRWPAFMDGITDLAVIEPTMRAWERAKEIEQWKGRFRELEVRPSAPDAGRLELRLLLLDQEARLQWRLAADTKFADLKQSQARSLTDQFEAGVLTIAPDSLSLWGVTYKPWSYSYQSWWTFKYHDPSAHPALNRLLRLPLDPERVVTAEGSR